ncbi:MAG TPA: ABC transporter ATP-binding protein [Bacteroidota bacterium]|nr:ABC transporter ATP-binding protein [Bacteroidota bacterium]
MMKTSVEVRNLHFDYAENRPALGDISFQIHEGETVGLIGPNGAGKSTLLMHLNGILPNVFGGIPSVFIEGLAVNDANILQIRRAVGLLFQDPDDQLFCPTVYEDVAFGPVQFNMDRDKVKGIVADALQKVGLIGYEGRSPHHLSSGEKQRVCLAGVLACQPKVLALDEPTRGLDPRGKRQFAALVSSIEATKIIATHDLEFVAEMCDRTIVMDEGSIVADGNTDNILSDEQLMFSHGLEKPHILKHKHPH